MRIPHQKQLYLGCLSVSQVALNVNCRDRMIPILRGLQHLYSQPKLRQQALDLIEDDVLGDADANRGRPGMTLWQILVLASVRLGCDCTYDHLQDLAENHINLRHIMQVLHDWKDEPFDWRRIRDNLCHVQPETIEKINHLIVAEGHRLAPAAVETIRGDSFVAETNKEAEETLERGREYFVRVLTGGVRTAQGLVTKKTRFFDDATRGKTQDIRKAFGRNVKEMVAAGGILCGDPARACEQLEAIQRVRHERHQLRRLQELVPGGDRDGALLVKAGNTAELPPALEIGDLGERHIDIALGRIDVDVPQVSQRLAFIVYRLQDHRYGDVAFAVVGQARAVEEGIDR